MNARYWTRDDLAMRMGGDFGIDRLALDLYLDVGPLRSNMRINPERYAKAFGTSEQFWTDLEKAYLEGLKP